MVNQPIDPATLYKAGHGPKKVPLIDCPGWLAAGWSYEAPSPAVPAQDEPTEDLPPPPAPKISKRSPKPPTD